MKRTSIFLLFLILYSHLCSFTSIATVTSTVVPALFIFGDSLLDSGNNNFLVTLARANFPPYGADFKGGATGRFTNGRTVADFTAQLLGLPFAPPYLSPRRLQNFTGVNFASGASGILPDSGSNLGECISLDQQITMFQKMIDEELRPKYGMPEELNNYLSKSIIMVSTGTNDYINNYLQPLFFNTSLTYSPQAFVQLLMERLFQQFQRLYTLGARKIIMFELGPIRCMPTYTSRLKPKGACVDMYNKLVSYFNDQFSITLNHLSDVLPGSRIIHGQTTSLVHDMIQNPSKYGFIDTQNPCCLAGEAPLACTPSLPPCPNDEGYLWWDGYHLTEAAYSTIARDCFSGSSTCFPINIKQLLQD